MDNCDYQILLKRVEELESQLHFYKDYDLLTGLYNKDTFYERVEKLLYQHKEEKFEIIYIDIERFKLVNDLYGTDQGNELLAYIAQQLKSEFFGKNVRFARLRADIFVIFKPYISLEDNQKTVRKLLKIFLEYPLDMEIKPAIGFYLIEDISVKVSLMCDRAALASESVKGDYSLCAGWYDHTMRNVLLEEQELLSGLDDSLKNGEFEVYIQPKCNMCTGKITGGEALVRWNHPQKGMISPASFIPIFEKNGFIKNLDQYVWEETAKWLYNRKKNGLSLVPVSVNISRIDIFGIDIVGFFSLLLEKYQLEPCWLELEITESAYINRVDVVIQVLEHLMKNGYTVLMDDFGSGFSSLNMLKDISIDILKLDMRFLDSNQKKSRNILESVVRMARWLNLKIIAEGVELEDQVEFLTSIGCTHAQGFYFYRPMPMKEFDVLLGTQDKVDFNDISMSEEHSSTLIQLRDFVAEDALSEVMLNNILGIVVLYAYDGTNVKVRGGNLKYYQTFHSAMPLGSDVSNSAIEKIYQEDRPLFFHAIEEAKIAGDKGASATIRRYLPDGNLRWFQVRVYFLSETNDSYIYYASISNISDYIEAVEDVKISNESFRIATESSEDVIFEVDIKTKTARFSLQSQEMFGFDDTFTDAPEGFIRQGSVLPEYHAAFRKMYEDIFNGAQQATCTVQASLSDGSVVWNCITLTTIRNQNGEPVKAVGIVKNINSKFGI